MTTIVYLKKSHQLFNDGQGLDYLPREDPAENGYTDPVFASLTMLANTTRCVSRGSTTRDYGLATRAVSTLGSHKENNSLLDDDNNSLASLVKFEPLRPNQSASLSMSATKMLASDQESEIEKEAEIHDGVPFKIPEWEEGIFWKRYGNRVRIGYFGLILYTGKLVKVNSIF